MRDMPLPPPPPILTSESHRTGSKLETWTLVGALATLATVVLPTPRWRDWNSEGSEWVWTRLARAAGAGEVTRELLPVALGGLVLWAMYGAREPRRARLLVAIPVVLYFFVGGFSPAIAREFIGPPATSFFYLAVAAGLAALIATGVRSAAVRFAFGATGVGALLCLVLPLWDDRPSVAWLFDDLPESDAALWIWRVHGAVAFVMALLAAIALGAREIAPRVARGFIWCVWILAVAIPAMWIVDGMISDEQGGFFGDVYGRVRDACSLGPLVLLATAVYRFGAASVGLGREDPEADIFA